MKRKFTALLLMMIICVSVFTGCSLFGRDDKTFYESVVATVSYCDGQKDEVKNRELIMAYRSYGYNYVDNYGYTIEKALETTLDTVIDNKIKIKDVENYYEEKGEKLLLDTETTYLWDSTFDAIYSNLGSYHVSGVNSSTNNTSSSSAETLLLKEVDGKYVIKINDKTSTTRDDYVIEGVVRDFSKEADREFMYSKLHDLVGNKQTQSQKDWDAAFAKYIKVIKENYPYLEYKTDKEWFMFEMDRVFNILKDNYLLERYSEIYNNQTGISPISVDEVLKSYSQKVRTDYTKYIVQNASTFATDLIADAANMDYIVEDSSFGNFFNVGYVKMALSQEQTKDLADLKADLEAGNVEDYDLKVKAVYERTSIDKKDADGEFEKSVGLTEMETELTKALSKTEDYDKIDAVVEYLKGLNNEEAVKGVSNSTVFGIKDGKVLTNETFKDNVAVETAIKQIYSKTTVGALSDAVYTDDAVYYFFYAGQVENLFEGITKDFDASKNTSNIFKLAETRKDVFLATTIFESIYKELESGFSSAFENTHMQYLKSEDAGIVSKIETKIDKLNELADTLG